MDSSRLPIWEVPQVKQKVAAVKKYIDIMVRKRNLYAWKFFVEDLKVDIELEIYKYDELHRQGKYKENGIGAYCNMAVQGALNYAFMYSAQKRKANFEAVSMDAMLETEKSAYTFQLPAKEQYEYQAIDLLASIQMQFGEKIHDLAQKVLDGHQLTTEELKQLRDPKVKPYLSELLREGN